MKIQLHLAEILCLMLLIVVGGGESKVVSSDKNEVSNTNGTVVVVNIHNLNKTQYHNQNFRQGNYNYGYDIKPDGPLGQFHHENKAEDGVVYGCYGYVDPLDKPQITFYVSDSWGYRPIKQGQSIKVFYPKDHPEGTTEMKGFELKWTQLQFPKQCDNLEEAILLANPKPILQAESAPILVQSTSSVSSPSPSPLSPSSTPTKPVTTAASKSRTPPLSVVLTYGPTPTTSDVSRFSPSPSPSNANRGNSYGGLTPEPIKALKDVESSVTPAKDNVSSGSGSAGGHGGDGGNGGNGGAAERSPGGNGGNGGSGGSGVKSPGGNGGRGGQGGKGGSAERSPGGNGGSGGNGGNGGQGDHTAGGNGGSGGVGGNGGSAERSPGGNGGHGGTGGNAIGQSPGKQQNLQIGEAGDAVGIRLSGVPSKSGTPVNNKKDEFLKNVVGPSTTQLAPPAANEGSGYHRLPDIPPQNIKSNPENDKPSNSNPYGQNGDGNDNYYAGSNKNTVHPDSNEAQYKQPELTQNQKQPNLTRRPNTGYYRPPSPTINYIQQDPKFTEPLTGYPGSTNGPSNLENKNNPNFDYGNSGVPVPSDASNRIRNPTAQISYPSSEESFEESSIKPVGSPNLHGGYPSPNIVYEDPSAQNGINYDNNPNNVGSNQPSNRNRGCGNSACSQQQQQPQAQDPEFIDYSQFPGAVVSNVPVIFYPDCRSNAFTRPAVVPFCPSLQPSSHQPNATPSCSHRQPLTMRFPSDKSNNIYSNYNLPATRGAYPSTNFVNTSNSPRQARRVVRRSRHPSRQVQNKNNNSN